MDELEHLSLVSKVCSELDNHFGLKDKEVAEFIIDLATINNTFDKFKTALGEQGLGDQFDDSLIANLLRLIQHMMPKQKGKKSKELDSHKITLISDAKDEIKARLPALAMPNTNTDDMMSQLENLMPKWKEAKEEIEEKTKEKPRRSRSRSRSWERKRKRSRSRDRDRDKKNGRDRYSGRRSRSPSTSRNKYARKNSEKERDSRRHSRERNRRNDRSHRIPETPEVGHIYNGRVNSIQSFGAFIQLDGLRHRAEGLCHISQLKNERVNAVADILSRGQRVKVKVLKMESGKISLSMKEVDQITGDDLNPKEPSLPPDAVGIEARNPEAPWANPERRGEVAFAPSARLEREFLVLICSCVLTELYNTFSSGKSRIRLSTPERWEIRQMQGAGVLPNIELPDFDEDLGVLKNYDGVLFIDESDGEDIEIELVEDEPDFLRGYGKGNQEIEPVKVVKNPDGSMAQAALMQGALSKERKESKIQAQREKDSEHQKSGFSSGARILDPMQDTSTNLYRDNDRGPNRRDKEMPEWMKHVTAGGKATYGRRTNLSMKEQRESLPIFGLKKPLIQAMNDNQILVVIGETGSGKTTQMTQYAVEAGFARRGRIGCTQPRYVNKCLFFKYIKLIA
uniref:S1 motif domain-containing protein n=1 Tax=Heterorhabditis bacteriophora TaxID=37862 RepID=A0A1I7XLM6_HETBA